MLKKKFWQLSILTLLLLFIPIAGAVRYWEYYNNPPEVVWEDFCWESLRDGDRASQLTIVCYRMEWTISSQEFKEQIQSKGFARIVRKYSAKCLMLDYYEDSSDSFFRPLFLKQQPFVVVFKSETEHAYIGYDKDKFFEEIRQEIDNLSQR